MKLFALVLFVGRFRPLLPNHLPKLLLIYSILMALYVLNNFHLELKTETIRYATRYSHLALH